MNFDENLLGYYQEALEFLQKASFKLREANRDFVSERNTRKIFLDPYMQRLVEAVGLLNAQTHFKLEAEFSDICQSLLNCISPDVLASIPAMSVIQFDEQENSLLKSIPAKTVLMMQTPQGESCYFTTGYEVQNVPFHVTYANLEQSTLCIQIVSSGELLITDYAVDSLQFFINAPAPYAYHLYELLFKNVKYILLADGFEDADPVFLDKQYLQAEGFSQQQCLLPYDPRKNSAHLLLTECCHYPEKFLFFSCRHLMTFFEKKKKAASLCMFIVLDTVSTTLAKQLKPDFFALNCTPVINVFPSLSEPLLLTHKQNAYVLKARLEHSPAVTDIYDVQHVCAVNSQGEEIIFQPMYGNIGEEAVFNNNYFYHVFRRKSHHQEMMVAFYSHHPASFYQAHWQVTAKILCTNRQLVAQLPYGGNLNHMDIRESGKPGECYKIKLLMPFTAVREAALEAHAIIRQLLLHLFIAQSPQNKETLLHTFEVCGRKYMSENPWFPDIVDVKHFHSQTQLHRREIFPAIVNGSDIHLWVETEKIPNSQLFFFGSILERYFAFQAEVNTYTRLTLFNRQKKIYQWPARCGENTIFI